MHFKKEQCLWVAQNLNSSILFLIFINFCHLYNQKHFSVLTQPCICPSFFSPPPNLIFYVCCLPSLFSCTLNQSLTKRLSTAKISRHLLIPKINSHFFSSSLPSLLLRLVFITILKLLQFLYESP